MLRERPRRFIPFYLGRHRWRRLALFLLAVFSFLALSFAIAWSGPTLKSAEGWSFECGGFLGDYTLKKDSDAWHVVDDMSVQRGDVWDQWEVEVEESPVFVRLPRSMLKRVGNELPVAVKRVVSIKVIPGTGGSEALVPLDQLPRTGLDSLIASIEKEASSETPRAGNPKMVARTLRASDHVSYEPWMTGVRWVASAYIIEYWPWCLPVILAMTALSLVSLCRSFSLFKRGACWCGYDLSGLASGSPCPECAEVSA